MYKVTTNRVFPSLDAGPYIKTINADDFEIDEYTTTFFKAGATVSVVFNEHILSIDKVEA